MGCPKEAVLDKNATGFEGVWIRKGDGPGRQPADSLIFFTKNGRNLVSFYTGWPQGSFTAPAEVETEYKFENGKLSLKEYSSPGNNFFPLNSFQWIVPNMEFTVRQYQILHFMSADYYVTYQKVN